MSALSDLLQAKANGRSGREISRHAWEAGVKISVETVATYMRPSHGHPHERTLEALTVAFDIPIDDLRRAAGVPIGEVDPWIPPPESNRLSHRQRQAVDELIRSMIET